MPVIGYLQWTMAINTPQTNRRLPFKMGRPKWANCIVCLDCPEVKTGKAAIEGRGRNGKSSKSKRLTRRPSEQRLKKRCIKSGFRKPPKSFASNHSTATTARPRSHRFPGYEQPRCA
jgi:hypothetical protein